MIEVYHQHHRFVNFWIRLDLSEISASNDLEIWCADLFRNGIGFLGGVPVDKIVVPISVDGDASARDHKRSRRDVDERSA